MVASHFKLVFRGKALAGFDADQVRQQLGELLKLKSRGLEQLFSGRLITLKRGLSREEASKYQQVLEQLGAEILLQPDKEWGTDSASVRSGGIDPSAGAANTAYQSQVKARSSGGNVTCPRCAHRQAMAEECGQCKMDLRLHLLRMQRKAKALQIRAAGLA
jgi:hypothetical protein